eukprot:TRINITY_DN19004_c0_g1_i1.p1 TRINITY_DN19004_c0_g1~~TRINITY_DN19004_c0_g1_i1.p1  ORF type:complete len:146 (+),score=31.15 TRINITY_DN19004_c0_g1_i1:67-504(+)
MCIRDSHIGMRHSFIKDCPIKFYNPLAPAKQGEGLDSKSSVSNTLRKYTHAHKESLAARNKAKAKHCSSRSMSHSENSKLFPHIDLSTSSNCPNDITLKILGGEEGADSLYSAAKKGELFDVNNAETSRNSLQRYLCCEEKLTHV